LLKLIFTHENEETYNEKEFLDCLNLACDEIVRRQVESGIDIVCDGENSKISYFTYGEKVCQYDSVAKIRDFICICRRSTGGYSHCNAESIDEQRWQLTAFRFRRTGWEHNSLRPDHFYATKLAMSVFVERS